VDATYAGKEINNMCFIGKVNIFSPLQVKNKPCDVEWNVHLFLA
jgi:hypothetical protein